MPTRSPKAPAVQIIDAATLEPLLTEAEAADYLSLKPMTLRRWRVDRTGPAYIKLRGPVRYRTSDLAAWLQAHRITAPAGDWP